MSVSNTLNVVFSNAQNIDKQDIKSLWIKSFGDYPVAVDLFLDKVFDSDRAFVATVDGKLCSMLFLLPCKICNKNAHYLYAACTDVNFRKLGIMSRLIKFALNQAKDIGDSYSVLLPASDSLYDFYLKFGYQKALRIKTCNIRATNIPTVADIYSNSDFDYLSCRNKYFDARCNFLKFPQNIVESAIDINSIYGGQTVVYNNSYAIVSALYNGARTVTEFVANSAEKQALIEQIFANCPADNYNFRINIKDENFKNCTTKDFGMILSLDNSLVPSNLYIGLTLD